MKKNYTIRDLIVLLLSKLWFIIIVSVLFSSCSLLVSKFVIRPRYESYTTMYVKNNNYAWDSSKGNINENVDLNDLNTAKSLAGTYITVLKSKSVMEQIGTKLEEKYSIDDLSSVFSIKKK